MPNSVRCVLIALCGLFASCLVAAEPETKPFPENAVAKDYGNGWKCKRGYQEVDARCDMISLPDNGYLTERSYGLGWECNRGFRREKETCVALEIPENAFLVSLRGDRWSCDRGFREINDACIPIAIPVNAYPNNSSYGTGWSCERGFQVDREHCKKVVLPEHAHLTASGSDWACDPPYRRRKRACSAR